MSKIEVYRLCPLSPEDESRVPFILLETYESIDGPRVRVCEGRWATQAEAHGMAAAKLLRRAGAK